MSCSEAFCCPCKLSWASKVSSDWPEQIQQIQIQKGAALRRSFMQASERGCYLHLPMVSPPFDVSRDSHSADGQGFTPFYISITNLTSLCHKLHLLQGRLCFCQHIFLRLWTGELKSKHGWTFRWGREWPWEQLITFWWWSQTGSRNFL